MRWSIATGLNASTGMTPGGETEQIVRTVEDLPTEADLRADDD